MWDHPWKNGAYTAYAKPTDPNRFDMPGVAVTPHDNSPAASTHLFRMEVIEWDGDCPKHVVFEGSGHGVDFDDPGHAGASD
jgi:hypothetical protein